MSVKDASIVTRTSSDEGSSPRRRRVRRWKKILGIGLISLASVIVLLTIAIAVVVNWVLTPEKVTPLVNQYANEYLDAEVKVEKVDLTFFSSYPRVELLLEKGQVISKVHRDSCFGKTDSLLRFNRCRVQLNLKAYLTKKRLVLREVELDSLRTYLFTDTAGVSNFQVFTSNTSDAADTLDSDTSSSLPFRSIAVRKLQVNDAYVYFDDRESRLYARVEGADIQTRIRLSDSICRLQLDYACKNLILWQEGQLLAHKMQMKVKTGVKMNRKLKVTELEDARIKVNQLGLGMKGRFWFDSIQQNLAMDLQFGLRTPSLKDVLSMIPKEFIDQEGIDAEGEVKLKGKLWGNYGDGVLPEASLSLNLLNGKAHYQGMPYGIDTLTAQLESYVDLNREKTSYADLKIMRLKAVDVDILASCKVDDLLGDDPYVQFSTRSDIDLHALMKVIPFHEQVAMGGQLRADVEGNFHLSHILNQDYGKAIVKGNVDLRKVYLNDTSRNFYSSADASLVFKSTKFLSANFIVNQIRWKGENLRAYVDTLQVRALSSKPSDDKVITKMGAEVSFKKLFARYNDSIRFYNCKAKAKATIKPMPDNPSKPFVNFDFETDTVYARMGNTQVRLREADVHLDLTRYQDSFWWPKAQIDFKKAEMIYPGFSMPVRLNRFKGNLDGGNIQLERANLRLGRSQLTIKGKVEKLWRVYKHGETLNGTLTLNSRMIDCNQLLNALSAPSDSLVQVDLSQKTAEDDMVDDALDEAKSESGEVDSLQGSSLFAVPSNLNLKINLNAKKIYYDNLLVEDVKGRILVRNQAVNLKKLDLKALGADMKMTMVYVAPTDKKADLGVDLDISGIQINRLVEAVPSFDSTLPMLRSFQGLVDLKATASAQVDSQMVISLPSLTSALKIQGKDLVLLDGETFAEISKLLLFKNKEKNLIDSISAVVAVQNGEVTVYPFMLEIDRYRVGVGGRQDLDMNFDYHISVLKSPVPFKLGINVRGNLDKMKIGVGKALYKNAFTPAYTRAVDSARLDLGRQITQQFEGWMDRERRSIRKVDFPTSRYLGNEVDSVQTQSFAPVKSPFHGSSSLNSKPSGSDSGAVVSTTDTLH